MRWGSYSIRNKLKPLTRSLQAIKKKYEESQNEIEKLKASAQDQKFKIDVLEAEKLRTVLKCEIPHHVLDMGVSFNFIKVSLKPFPSLEAEKKSFEVRLNEANLKLKLKTAQCDSLLASREKDDAPSSVKNPLQTIQTENEPIVSTSSSRKPPQPKQRKRKLTNSANKENLSNNGNKICTRSRWAIFLTRSNELRTVTVRCLECLNRTVNTNIF